MSKLVRKLVLAGVATASLLSAVPASAATVFDFLSQTATGFQASGQLTCAGSLAADSSCFVTAITGTVTNSLVAGGTAQAITGLSSYNGADGKILYYPSDPNYPNHGDLTLSGLSFTTSSVANPLYPTYNLFSRGFDSLGPKRIFENNDGPGGNGPIKLGVPASFRLTPVVTSAVPEPATWAMMLVGFGFAGASLRKRRHTQGFSFSRKTLAQAI